MIFFFKFGPAVQEAMLFKYISNLQLWWPYCSMVRNHLGNFGRGHIEEHFCEIFIIWTSGSGDVVLRYFLSTAMATILFSGAEPFEQCW